MSESDDRARWEERHARAATEPVAAPSPFVAHHVARLGDRERRPRALDLACGGGRHTRTLVDAGFAAIALDASPTAVRRAVAGAPGALGVVADAHALPFRDRSFALIVKTCFLERALFADLARLLRPGGHLLAETFRLAQHERTGHPRRDFCLADGELERLCAAAGLSPLEARERGDGAEAGAALGGILARRG